MTTFVGVSNLLRLSDFITMRPEHLQPPFLWDQRRVVIHDCVWYVPKHCHNFEEFVFPGWRHLFGNDNPVNIEYCSGNGAWIAAKAADNPQCNWVAVELKFKRARKIWSKLKNLKLSNLLVVCGEGHNATARYFPASSVSNIFINFPDPWPKTRHTKNRIIQPAFISEMCRVLNPGALMTFVTDDVEYSDWLIKMMQTEPGFANAFQDHFTTEYEGYGTSYFEQLWRDKGKVIRYHKFVKTLPRAHLL